MFENFVWVNRNEDVEVIVWVIVGVGFVFICEVDVCVIFDIGWNGYG